VAWFGAMAGLSTMDSFSSAARTAERSSAYSPGVRVRVLGPVEVVVEGQQVPLGGPKQRTVLALLAAERGRPLSVDSLIDGVWGETPTTAAKSTLQTYISNLRSQLGPALVREGGGYRLAIEPDEIDAGLFEASVESARQLIDTQPMDASQQIRESLELWRGHAYADVSPSLRLEDDARRLSEMRVSVIEDAIDAELRLGYDAELVAELEVLCAEYPFRERFREQHMLALYRSGRQAEALRAYEKTRRFLGDELGIDPSPRLQELEQRILEHDAALLVEAHPRVETRVFLLVVWDYGGGLGRSELEDLADEAGSVIAKAGGRVSRRFRHGLEASFEDVGEAVAAAEGIHRRRADDAAPSSSAAVRTAIDVGEVEVRSGEYFGPPLNRAARLVAAAHGGQALISADAHARLSSDAAGWRAKALGEHEFQGLGRPQPVFQLILERLPESFPPLRLDRPPALPAAGFGRMVRGYEIRDAAATGPTGVVYHGYQPSVGREVAINVTRPELVNNADFIARFEAEARLVARLDHPHIIRLHDYWRDPSGAYMVTQWMGGGSLADALSRGSIDSEGKLRVVRQIGEALAFAHSSGVAHGGLGVDSVLLDDQGNAYLSGFRVAPVESEDATGDSFPGRMGRDVGDFAGLVSRLVDEDSSSGHRPEATVTADQEPASIEDVVARLEFDLAGVATARPATSAPNPYKGLRAFEESDHLDFHGREEITAELIARLSERRLVAVVGPSGIGKSSVVRAGLIPALRNGALPGSEKWLITDATPGAYPFDALSAALSRVATNWPDAVSERLGSEEGMLGVIKRMIPPDTPLVLVLDQFEELFTHVSEEKTRRRFIDGLHALVADPTSPVRLVVTLRADYLDGPLLYPGLGELIREGMVVVSVPTHDELSAAIRLPAERVGVDYEAGLMERIIEDVDLEPGGLPLLQYALTEMFASRRYDTLSLDDYQSSGGVIGALGLRAETVYSGLSVGARSAVADVLVRLVSVEEAGRDARRRAFLSELRNLDVDTSIVGEVLDRFGEHRLLTFDRDPATRSPTVEVAHEALISRWDRFRGWIEERREDLLLRERLAWAVREWQERGEDPRFLLEGGRLEHLAGWADQTVLRLTQTERRYLATSGTAQEARDARRRRIRRSVTGTLGAAALIMSILALVAFNSQQEARVAAQAASSREFAALAVRVVESDTDLALLLALQGIHAAPDPQAPPLEAVTALHVTVQAQRTLLTRTWDVEGDTGPLFDGVLGPHGDLVAATRGAETLQVWDADSGEVVWEIRDEAAGGWWSFPQFNRDGTLLAAAFTRYWSEGRRVDGGLETGVYLFDPPTGEVIAVLPPAACEWVGLPAGDAFTPDGTHLIRLVQPEPPDPSSDCFGEPSDEPIDLRLDLVELASGDITRSFPVSWSQIEGEAKFIQATVTAALDRILITDADSARLLDLGTGEELWNRPRTHGALSPDGSLAALGAGGAAQRAIDLVDPETNETLRQLIGHSGGTFHPVFSDDGRLLYTPGEDGTARVWDTSTGENLITLGGATGGLNRVSVTEQGDRLAAPGEDGAFRVWDLTAGSLGEGMTIGLAPAQNATRGIDAAGGKVAVSLLEGTPPDHRPVGLVIDTVTGEILHRIDDFYSQMVALTPDGSLLAHQGNLNHPEWAGPLVVRATSTASVLNEMEGWCVEAVESEHLCARRPQRPYRESAQAIAFNEDGTLLAAGGYSHAVSIWETETGAARTTWVVGEPSVVIGVSFQPHGSLVAALANMPGVGRVDVRDTDGGPVIALDAALNANRSGHISFSPDGTLLAVGGERLTVFETDGWTVEWEVTAHDGGVFHFDFSPDGSRIATTGSDGLVRIWNTEDGTLHQAIPMGGDWAKALAYVDDNRIVVGTSGGLVATLIVDVEELVAMARDRLTRGFTERECQTYLHLPSCPTD
jgi:DNA-binding SARP family transcriptional activator/WD40 repeat protein